MENPAIYIPDSSGIRRPVLVYRNNGCNFNSAGFFKAEEGSSDDDAVLGKISILYNWQEAAY